MIGSMMLYLVVVSGLAAVAAWLAETGLRSIDFPARWVWVLALVAAPALLGSGTLRSDRAPDRLVGAASGPVIELPAPVAAPSADGGLNVDRLLLVLWIGSGVTLGLVVFAMRARLTRRRSGWRRIERGGRAVWLSEDCGPALAGVLRPWIVLPRWFDALTSEQQEFVLLHEEEHARAGDSRLLAAVLTVLCFTAWNPIAWVALRRLQGAMEVDCDRRVLRHRPDPSRYGDSLLAVAARTSGRSLAFAAFTERASSLRQRIVAMTQRPTRWTSLRAALLTLAAVAMAVQACSVDVSIDDRGVEARARIGLDRQEETPSTETEPASTSVPSRPGADPESEAARPDARDRRTVPAPPASPTTEDLAAAPTFTPFTAAPSILNRQEVVQAMADAYPPLLRDAGVGGMARIFFLIGEDGGVRRILLDRSSGHEALDRAALRVADVYRFSPALNRDQKVPVWVSFPITFKVR